MKHYRAIPLRQRGPGPTSLARPIRTRLIAVAGRVEEPAGHAGQEVFRNL